MDIRNLTACFLIGLFLSVATALADEETAGRPHYLLTAGREFRFHNEARSEEGDGTVYIVDWKVWAVGRDPDGAWRLVIRCDLKMKQNTPGNPPADHVRADTLVWRCRMFEDGRLVGATTMGTVRDPYRLFPRLPANPVERERGWDSAGSEKDGSTLHHQLTPGTKADGASLSITTRIEGVVDKVYVSTHESRATFDVRRGVVTRVETEDHNGYPSPGVTRGTIELVGVEERGGEWATAFGREADRYFDAVEAYDAMRKGAVRDRTRCQEILAEAKVKLDEAKAGLTTPVFLDAISQRLAEHGRVAESCVERANEQAAYLGKPAADWKAKDIEGKTHRLADYRGKVVIMDFWYRGCGWCMYAMPQVNRISESFRDEPVAVLGMTIDENDKDARVVIDAMGLKYPTIKAIGIPEKYGVQGYPTLVVVDKEGKVREIHVGYSPRLYEELAGLIRELLAEKPTD